MKNFSYFLIIILLTACSNNGPIDKNSIKICRIKQNPVLVDHCKKLMVVDKNNKIIDEAEIYCDPGTGCNSYLYDTDKTFTVIDCNGQWYIVDKQIGKISKESWQWEKQLPAKYVGTFVYKSDTEFYSLLKEENVKTENVYKYKDPTN